MLKRHQEASSQPPASSSEHKEPRLEALTDHEPPEDRAEGIRPVGTSELVPPLSSCLRMDVPALQQTAYRSVTHSTHTYKLNRDLGPAEVEPFHCRLTTTVTELECECPPAEELKTEKRHKPGP